MQFNDLFFCDLCAFAPLRLCGEIFNMTQNTIDTVVFDLGNVLISFNPRWLYRKLLPDEAAIDRFFAETAFDAWNAQMDGGLSFAEGIAAQSARFPHYRPLFEAFFERWQETIGGAIPESLAVFQALRQAGLRTYALSNFSAETYPQATRRFPFLNDFDGSVISGQEGVSKPDPAIYALLCQRYSIAPERAVFIDDKLENVETARQLGMHGIHFTDPQTLPPALRALGLRFD